MICHGCKRELAAGWVSQFCEVCRPVRNKDVMRVTISGTGGFDGTFETERFSISPEGFFTVEVLDKARGKTLTYRGFAQLAPTRSTFTPQRGWKWPLTLKRFWKLIARRFSQR